MELLLFGLALTATHFIGLFVLFVLFCVATAYDRRGNSVFKWLVLFATLVVVGIVISPTWDFQVAKEFVLSAALWVPVGVYAAIGLLYSGLEFLLTVRRSVRKTADRWAAFLKDYVPHGYGGQKSSTNGQAIERAKAEDATEDEVKTANSVINHFSDMYKFDFIGFEKQKDSMNIEPKIDRLDLAQYIGAWVVFWPFYLVSLVLGDLLTELFQSIADFVAEHCGRFVRNAFSGVFKT